MAQRVTILDDISGEEGAATIGFSLAGKKWEIDVTDATLAKMEQALARYIKVARDKTPVYTNGDSETQKVRNWLTANGHQVSPKGRIPQELQDVYDAAHPQEETLLPT